MDSAECKVPETAHTGGQQRSVRQLSSRQLVCFSTPPFPSQVQGHSSKVIASFPVTYSLLCYGLSPLK